MNTSAVQPFSHLAPLAPLSPLLEARSLSFRIQEKVLLDAVSFRIEAGERISLIGPNGAGKTTLLKCLTRVHRHYSGEILVEGSSLKVMSQKALARRLAWVPQSEEAPPPFTVEDFVGLGRYAHLKTFQLPTVEDREAVESALEVTRLEEFRHRTMATLSGGERQKVSIAAALAQGSPFLLLDEPATFLDPRQALDIEELLGRLNRENGRTLLVVTHDLNRALLDSHRVLGLKAGKLLFNGPPSQLQQEGMLDRLFDRSDRPFPFAPHPETGQSYVIPDTIHSLEGDAE